MTTHHTLPDIAPVAPPTIVTSLAMAGIPLSDLVLVLNAVYIVLGIAYLLYKWRKQANDNSRR